MSLPEMPALLAAYELTGQLWRGTFYWGRISDAALTDSYIEAARRLRTGATDNEDTERVFFPILFLYRHAIELQLKQAIHGAAHLRRTRGETSKDLESGAVQKRLTGPIGHKVAKLQDELDAHRRALGDEDLSEFAQGMLELLDSTSPNNTMFRFPGALPDQHISIDIDRLVRDLEKLYGELGGVVEYLIVRVDHENDRES